MDVGPASLDDNVVQVDLAPGLDADAGAGDKTVVYRHIVVDASAGNEEKTGKERAGG